MRKQSRTKAQSRKGQMSGKLQEVYYQERLYEWARQAARDKTGGIGRDLT